MECFVVLMMVLVVCVASIVLDAVRLLRQLPADLARLTRTRHLHLGDGDVLVLLYPDHLNADKYEALRAHVQKFAPGNKVLVLDSGLDIEVLHRKKAREIEERTGDPVIPQPTPTVRR